MTDTREPPERHEPHPERVLVAAFTPGEEWSVAATPEERLADPSNWRGYIRADLPRDDGVREAARVLLDLLCLPENGPRLYAAIQAGEAAYKDGGSYTHAFLTALAADATTPEEDADDRA